ncbi:MAG: MauE/DoxX family redox-associated membrane protein [Candidatus Limimorpha sp.]
MSSKTRTCIDTIIRLSVGAFLIATAVLKLVSIDSFELYIYSFNILSYSVSTVLSRLVIASEMFLGLCLMLKVFYRQAWYLTMAMMSVFSVFLIFTYFFRSDENCHCMGDIISMRPGVSIIKNIVIIILLLLIKVERGDKMRRRAQRLGAVIALLISLIIPFAIVPNDMIYNKIFSKEESINTEAFYESVSDSTYVGFLKIIPEKRNDTIIFVEEERLMSISEGRFVINYALSGCKYCKMGAERLSIMFKRHGIEKEKLKFVIGGGPISMSMFIKMTDTYEYGHWKISPHQMMELTYGVFPLYVFVEDGDIIKTVDFRHLDETEIIEFLR